MIAFEDELGVVLLLFTETEEAGHVAAAVGPFNPGIASSPFEFGALRLLTDHVACREEKLDIDSIVNGSSGARHAVTSGSDHAGPVAARPACERYHEILTREVG